MLPNPVLPEHVHVAALLPEAAFSSRGPVAAGRPRCSLTVVLAVVRSWDFGFSRRLQRFGIEAFGCSRTQKALKSSGQHVINGPESLHGGD